MCVQLYLGTSRLSRSCVAARSGRRSRSSRSNSSRTAGRASRESTSSCTMVGSAASSARSAPVKNSLVYHLRQDLVCSRLTANAAANLTGKTSLMHAILGELDKTRGSVAVKGTVAYAAQVTPSGLQLQPHLDRVLHQLAAARTCSVLTAPAQCLHRNCGRRAVVVCDELHSQRQR